MALLVATRGDEGLPLGTEAGLGTGEARAGGAVGAEVPFGVAAIIGSALSESDQLCGAVCEECVAAQGFVYHGIPKVFGEALRESAPSEGAGDADIVSTDCLCLLRCLALNAPLLLSACSRRRWRLETKWAEVKQLTHCVERTRLCLCVERLLIEGALGKSRVSVNSWIPVLQ